MCVCVWGGGGGGEGGAIGRDVLTNGVLLSESVWSGRGGGGRGCFVVKYLGKDSNITVWKGVHACLERGVVNYLSQIKTCIYLN